LGQVVRHDLLLAKSEKLEMQVSQLVIVIEQVEQGEVHGRHDLVELSAMRLVGHVNEQVLFDVIK